MGRIDQIYQDTWPLPTRINCRQHATLWEYIGWTSTLKTTNVAPNLQHPQIEDVKVSRDNTLTTDTEISINEEKIK